MIITIVCVCGHHNAVHCEDLESARCWCCGAILLRPQGYLPAPALNAQTG